MRLHSTIFLLKVYTVDWSVGAATPVGTVRQMKQPIERVAEGMVHRSPHGKSPPGAEIVNGISMFMFLQDRAFCSVLLSVVFFQANM